MKDIVFLKENIKKDRLWENNPHLAVTGYMFIAIFVIFALGYIEIVLLNLPESLITVASILNFFIPIGVMTYIVVKKNSFSNLSKSIGFVKRDNKLYAIVLGYSYNSATINAPSGTIYQAATLSHNVKVAKDIQELEKNIRECREKEETYIDALDNCLIKLNKNPKKYYGKKSKGETGFYYPKVDGVEGFLILEEPRLEKENKNYIWISFTNRFNERETIKFRNAYGNLKEEINYIGKGGVFIGKSR